MQNTEMIESLAEEETIDIEEDRKALEQMLLRGEWIEEANDIPLEDLDSADEQLVVIKCRKQSEMTEEEIGLLKDVLGRYREAIRKYEPTETIETVEKNMRIAKDMNSILEQMRNTRSTTEIDFCYPLTNKESILIKILVDNEIDAETIDNLQENLGLFEDLTQDELETYSKYSHNEAMTREEQAIARKIEEKIAEMNHTSVADIRETAIKFLAKQTRIATDKNCTEEQMTEFYSIMKIGPLLALFERVQSSVGISDINRDELFQ